MTADNYEDALTMRDENSPSPSTSPSGSPISKDKDECDKSLTFWSKSDFDEKYMQSFTSIDFGTGTGAFSKVYLGSNIVTSAQVAVKVIDRTTLREEEQERLMTEIDIMRELSHENILSKFLCPLCISHLSNLPMMTQPLPNPSFSFLLRLLLMISHLRYLP